MFLKYLQEILIHSNHLLVLSLLEPLLLLRFLLILVTLFLIMHLNTFKIVGNSFFLWY